MTTELIAELATLGLTVRPTDTFVPIPEWNGKNDDTSNSKQNSEILAMCLGKESKEFKVQVEYSTVKGAVILNQAYFKLKYANDYPYFEGLAASFGGKIKRKMESLKKLDSTLTDRDAYVKAMSILCTNDKTTGKDYVIFTAYKVETPYQTKGMKAPNKVGDWSAIFDDDLAKVMEAKSLIALENEAEATRNTEAEIKKLALGARKNALALLADSNTSTEMLKVATSIYTSLQNHTAERD